ncbi:lyase family protein [Streptomyces tubbatahanensis]|uniref:argininosuccinate lyase n=1 Tax=Streptomyces tubbatahanensis TaxID=2923272 RepID=A0ABY3XKV6_9ACTN|nr:lyase family protein [Streptomyces tubbatahanensis]UNS95045.1 lyase family protein [Streptomyces tubbatahanensis]
MAPFDSPFGSPVEDPAGGPGESALTGRISAGPHPLLRSEVLEPQLRHELDNLLPHYIRAEKVLLAEYHRMGVLTTGEVTALDTELDAAADPAVVGAVAAETMSDIAFAIERTVTTRIPELPPAWHVDRSRNDLQATAQACYGRARLLEVEAALIAFGRSALEAAHRHETVLLPGYTHAQPAQIISPAFYLSALTEQVLHALRRIDAVDRSAACPLGAGAMAGQELAWDRDRMARLLGFDHVSEHALRAVAQRDWALEATAELSLLGTSLSRFATDLMTWGGAGHGFIDLPDEWSGISSAMPQKKNFPVLERIRARTAHLTAAHLGIAAAQRSTPYTNSVEISKEASAQVPAAFDTALSVLRLFTAVVDRLTFEADRTLEACRSEHFGGFTLANLLTLRARIPWRAAQVLAGRYVVAATAAGLSPAAPDPGLLRRLAEEAGHTVADADDLLRTAFDVPGATGAKRSTGSTAPEEVRRLCAAHAAELGRFEGRRLAREARMRRGARELDETLAHLAGTRASC